MLCAKANTTQDSSTSSELKVGAMAAVWRQTGGLGVVVVRLGATVVGSLGVVGGLCPSVLVPLQEGSPLAFAYSAESWGK